MGRLRLKKNTNNESYEKKMQDAFMAHIGRCYEEQLHKENIEFSDKKAPESLDLWFQEFCREKWGEEELSNSNVQEKINIENYSIKDMIDSAQEYDRKDDTDYRVLAAYAKLMNYRFQKQQEKKRRFRKIAVFIVVFLGIAASATITARAFHFNLWKYLIRDEGTNVIIGRTESLDERNYYLSSDWVGYYYPAYIPEGYELVKEEFKDYGGRLEFRKGEDILTFFCAYFEDALTLDKERGSYESIDVGEQKGYFAIYEELSTAYLYVENYTISIYYKNISVKEIKKIIERIKLFDKK